MLRQTLRRDKNLTEKKNVIFERYAERFLINKSIKIEMEPFESYSDGGTPQEFKNYNRNFGLVRPFTLYTPEGRSFTDINNNEGIKYFERKLAE